MQYVDPRLSRQLRDASPDTPIDAIVIIVEPHQDPLQTQVDKELVKQILQKITEQTNERPSFVRLIPKGNAIALTANSIFINSLLNHPCVQIASSVTVAPFHL